MGTVVNKWEIGKFSFDSNVYVMLETKLECIDENKRQ